MNKCNRSKVLGGVVQKASNAAKWELLPKARFRIQDDLYIRFRIIHHLNQPSMILNYTTKSFDRFLLNARYASAVWALAISVVGQAAKVEESVAREAGQRFFATSSIGRDATDFSLAYTSVSGSLDASVNCFYVFNEASGGFVIIAGDDVVQPILAYSADRAFDAGDIPVNVAKWLEGYKMEILDAIENGTATRETEEAWGILLGEPGSAEAERSNRSVDPLLQTTWNQLPYYNSLCPGGSVSGCVATAMAQIMKFWNYPETGAGFHQYDHDQYGTLAANFGGTSYQWASMPNNVSSANNAVATLMYHCGVSVNMQYSPTSSGAYVINDLTNTPFTAENALEEFFGYQQSLQGVMRSNYTDAQWINLLRTELDASRPILHAGSGDGGGHAFVCDGYDDNNFFHFNWGWGGIEDGYFTINALNPGNLGTGGGSGGYNSQQHAIIGIQPPAGSTSFDMALYDYVTPTSTALYYGQAFTVTTNIANNGTNTFSGDYCAAAFDDNGNFVDYIETLTGYSLESGFVYTDGLTFSTDGIFGMVPGSYNIGIFYRPNGGNWIQVADDGAYYNMPEVTVFNPNDIALNSSITVSPGGSLVQGAQASVNLNIVNDGASTFLGEFFVGLYNLDGSFVQDIGTITEDIGLESGYTYLSPFLTFGPATITASPGTYLIAAQHNPNGTGWQLTGSGSFMNPITVTVVAPSTSPDVYEVNNTAAQSYSLPVTFSGTNAASSTNGSNLHVTSDLDHYKVVLPSGYNYEITARLHDSYNSGNGITYTADCLFSWSTDGNNWSSTFDDVMSGIISVDNGGTVFFKAAPFFAGEVGTYLLQLNITRASTVGLFELETAAMKVFPNPVSDAVAIDLGDHRGEVERILLLDERGSLVKDLPQSNWSAGLIQINVTDVAAGCYQLLVRTATANLSQRVIIAR